MTEPRTKPARYFTVNDELVVVWEDGVESYIPLTKMRKVCPCAGCGGESDILGKLHRGPLPTYQPESFRIRSIEPVGGYALQPVWGDGHSTGIYTFDLLRRLGEAAA